MCMSWRWMACWLAGCQSIRLPACLPAWLPATQRIMAWQSQIKTSLYSFNEMRIMRLTIIKVSYRTGAGRWQQTKWETAFRRNCWGLMPDTADLRGKFPKSASVCQRWDHGRYWHEHAERRKQKERMLFVCFVSSMRKKVTVCWQSKF